MNLCSSLLKKLNSRLISKNLESRFCHSQVDTSIQYIPRTAQYYRALGYPIPYRWASYDEVPFTLPKKPLNQSTVTIITTAAPFREGLGDQGPGAEYNAGAKFYDVYSLPTANHSRRLCISHISYDRKHTTAEDPNTYFPLAALLRKEQQGEIGKVANRFHGAPTNRSQRITMEKDAVEILKKCKEDNVDIAFLVPNCPICHQSVALIARLLEANEIPTVIIGCAKDVVERVGVPRFIFNDFPLGNSSGKPHDLDSQNQIMNLAFDCLRDAIAPRTTIHSNIKWSEDESWKNDCYNASKWTEDRKSVV